MKASNRSHQSIPWHRNPKVRAVLFQLLAVLFLIWFFYGIANNASVNMADRGIIIGLNFMGQVAPFNIGFAPFWDYQLGVSQYWEVLVIGIQNTIFVSFLSVVAATLLGFFIGVMRLSPNWLAARLASAYVEVFRNIPLPLWIFFWYVAVFLPLLPDPKNSFGFGGGFYLNKEGLYTPRPIVDDMTGGVIFAILVGLLIIALLVLSYWAKRRRLMSGRSFPTLRLSLLAWLILPVSCFYILGSPLHIEYPEMGRFVMSGGINLNFSFFVMFFSLTTYTAAYIGENVRAGILSVASGQSEAAYSLGLPRIRVLRLVLMPQALRVIIPPTISQYLNLTKNSSLAVIVAYEDVVNIFAGIALNQTGQALPIIAITILIYGVLSLLTSAILNWYNKRIQLTEQ